MDLLLLFIVTLASALVSLVGGLYLIYGKLGARQIQRVAVPIAAGALLAAVFFDLLPEALHSAGEHAGHRGHDHDHDHGHGGVLLATLIGFITFFILERSFSWFHHHHDEEVHGRSRNIPLIIAGDSLHNFIDGLAIGAAFLISPATGVVTAIAIAAHEIPQEIGDFGLLLDRGMKKKRVVIVNLISSLLTIVGALIVFFVGQTYDALHPALLAFTAGCFIYIAASDIIPTIHQEPSRKTANIQTLVMLVSIIVVAAVIQFVHGYIAH